MPASRLSIPQYAMALAHVASLRSEDPYRKVGAAALDALVKDAGVAPEFVDRWLADDLRREAYLDQRFAALDADRRVEAIRLWIAGLRARANIAYRIQRF